MDFTLPRRLFDRRENTVLKMVDAHAGGEPARIVLAGVQKRAYMVADIW